MELVKDFEKQAFARRLEEAAKAAGQHYYGMYSDVARHFNMTPRGVQKWFIGESIPEKKIGELAAYYRVRAEWLRCGKGPMREVEGINATGEPMQVQIHSVPVVSPEHFRAFLDGNLPLDGAETVLATGKLPQMVFAIKIEDNSLADRVLRGMYVVVDHERKPEPDDLAVAWVDGSFIGGRLVKRGNYIIIPPNTAFPPLDIGPDPEIAGTMISIAQQPLTQPQA